MWNKLHNVCEQKSSSGMHFLQQKFYNYVKDSEDSIAVHIAKLEEIVQLLNDMGESISDTVLSTKIFDDFVE